MEPNPYKSPQLSPNGFAAGQGRPPTVRLATVVSVVSLYLPVAWIPFCERAELVMSDSDWPFFVLTLPGEWYAQRCGARMYDYYFFRRYSDFMPNSCRSRFRKTILACVGNCELDLSRLVNAYGVLALARPRSVE